MHPADYWCKNSEYYDILEFYTLPAGRLNAQNCKFIFS